MNVEFRFSFIGLLFLMMLTIPNLLWSQNQPEAYEHYVHKENKVLLILERIGEIATTCISLFFANLHISSLSFKMIWLLLAFILMIIYELYWIHYFQSDKTMKDFYNDYLKIPVAGATLPVLAFFILGIYGQSMLLIISTVILGIGHIGIHLNHQKEIRKDERI